MEDTCSRIWSIYDELEEIKRGEYESVDIEEESSRKGGGESSTKSEKRNNTVIFLVR